jgi:hypothetical protein
VPLPPPSPPLLAPVEPNAPSNEDPEIDVPALAPVAPDDPVLCV